MKSNNIRLYSDLYCRYSHSWHFQCFL